MEPSVASSVFELGDWIVEPDRNRIRNADGATRLEPLVMRLLICLAEAEGRTVLRSDLLERLWPDVNVNEEAISRAVSDLRRSLGDDARRPTYVETIHKKGYRLLVDARPVAAATVARAGASRRRRIAGGGLVALALGAVTLWLAQAPDTDPPGGRLRATARPLTTFPGREIDPALAPDGHSVVFAWNGGSGDYDLYVKPVASESVLRLTETPGFEGHPVWSPDGSEIAFVRGIEGGGSEVLAVPAIGGAERRIVALSSWSYGLDWSPDGKWIAVSEEPRGRPAAIHLVSLITGERRRLTEPPEAARGDYRPVFLGDTGRLAFIRTSRIAAQQLYVADLQGSAPERQLSAYPARIRGFDWLGGELLLVCREEAGTFEIGTLDLAEGRFEPLGLLASDLFNPSVSARGDLAAVEAVKYDVSIWRARLSSAGVDETEPWLASTRQDLEPRYSPDGAWIAFVSDRDGSPQLWRSRADGGEPLRLTAFESGRVAAPVWSPDGRRIVFGAAPAGRFELFVVDAFGGLPERLAAGGGNALPAGWSRDGESIYFVSDRADAWRLWRTRPDGGESSAVGVGGVASVAETAGGGLLYARQDGALILRAPDGVERTLAEGVAAWTPSGGDVLFVVEPVQGLASLHRLDPESGSSTEIGTLEGFQGRALSVSPSGTELLYERLEQSDNDLVLVSLLAQPGARP